ncbi:CoA transferase [Streptomyces sp. NBC_00056]|uniref:CaiB/BaiF CoA transferase family protein n=1 Tax=unclassified Streptomyces TaxID=2593676 RepID=UPI002257729C|nr:MULTISPECIES: CaiB/BaiF CoA-transferase family protein [unclassified Streptomyces]MCX5442540.1 CoA transferase [Streptomyces sp. NBC_00063]WUB91261.1 CoA transferase [Streptomyces sp. NBC_00569]
MSPAGGASGPLAGVRVVELGGLGPGPFCGMMLADLGAEVIRVDRPAEAGQETRHPVIHRGRTSIAVDLKHPEGADAVRQLIAGADAVIEGFRPGAVERLGLGPDVCLASNPKLVYGRMTGWGQDGPLAQEPGHDINYIALAGALHAIAPAGGDPVPPVNLIGDFGGGGMLLALGLVSALLHARTTGEGQVVDAAMTDGTALLLSMTYGFLSQGGWEDKPGVNLLDGGAPFYAVYRCADDRHVALGAIEPQFYAALLGVLGLAEEPEFARQRDRETWPAMKARLTRIFATRTRDEWGATFEGQGACVTPVLSLTEAAEHPHNTARGTFRRGSHGGHEPAPAPRFGATPAGEPRPAPVVGAHTSDILARATGLTHEDIETLREKGIVG